MLESQGLKHGLSPPQEETHAPPRVAHLRVHPEPTGLATEQDLREGPGRDPQHQAPRSGAHPCPLSPSRVTFPREGSARHPRHPSGGRGGGAGCVTRSQSMLRKNAWDLMSENPVCGRQPSLSLGS